MVVFAGFLAHQHLLRLPGVMLCAFAGSLIADQALFYLGRRWRDHRLVLRLRAKPAFAKALAAVDRHPDGFILSLRFLYGLRTVGPIALGVSNAPAPRFLVLNVVAAAIWAVCFSLLGYLFDRPSSRCWGGCMASKPSSRPRWPWRRWCGWSIAGWRNAAADEAEGAVP